MKKDLDILLVNSFAPRQRISSDAGLENGLAIIRTYLTERGFQAEVLDEQRISSVEQGVPAWCVGLLRWMTKIQIKAYQSRITFLHSLLFFVNWPLQALSMYSRKQYMEKLIEDIVVNIKENNILVIGIKVWYGDAFVWSRQLAARVQAECPDTVVIAGGPQVKVYGEAVLAGAEFDLAIMGPGEIVLEQLLTLRQQAADKQEFMQTVLSKVSNTRLIAAWGYFEEQAASKQVDAYKLTVAQYRQVDMDNKIFFHTLVDGFGCSWKKCNFCTHTRQRMTYQTRPVAEIIAEMKAMTEQGIGFFRFSSSETPLYHGKQIAQAILDAGLKVNYSMFKRPEQMSAESYEAYKLMIQSGLRAVFMGGETGNNAINEQVMNKGVLRKEIVDTIHCIKLAAQAVGESCRIGLSLIYPSPVVAGVELADIYAANISLIQETLPDTVIVNPPIIFPATQWFEHAEQFGFTIGEDYVRKLMQYEYSIYKPAELWEKLNYTLNGMSNLELLKETGKLRKAVADMGIPTDISDEYLMMTEAIGYKSKFDLLQFKKNSLLDIMTGSASYATELGKKINEYGRLLADQKNK